MDKSWRSTAPRLIYVSCDVATLARDARRIVRRTATRSSAIDGFDLFPNTPHVETVVVFTRSVDRMTHTNTAHYEGRILRDLRVCVRVLLGVLRDVVVGDRFLRRLEEALEQRAELAGAEEVLRVPLDAEAEARRRILDRFDDAVRRRRRRR